MDSTAEIASEEHGPRQHGERGSRVSPLRWLIPIFALVVVLVLLGASQFLGHGGSPVGPGVGDGQVPAPQGLPQQPAAGQLPEEIHPEWVADAPTGPYVSEPAPGSTAASRPRTVVSLTFDDGNANQGTAVDILDAFGLKATFYIVSGVTGTRGYFTREDLEALAASGHEIGGHTVNHVDLTTVPLDEASRQICEDRRVLTSWGFEIRSFAYPFAGSNPDVEELVKECGYSSARELGDIKSRFGCPGCHFAETIPPADAFYTNALKQVDSTWTLRDLKKSVTNAEKAGGWVQLTFHNICSAGCADPSTTPKIFSDFLRWLEPRAQSRNTVVQTVGETVGGEANAVVTGARSDAAPSGVNAIVNPGLESVGDDGVPECWMQGGYGGNAAEFSTALSGVGGSASSDIAMADYLSGDAKLLPRFDLGACTPTVVPGHSYSLRVWYLSTASVQFAVYLRSEEGTWRYWTSSPWFDAHDDFQQAAWTTPDIPAGMTGLSFGLSIFASGVLTTDDYAMYDSDGAPPTSGPAPATPRVAPEVGGPVEVVHISTDSDQAASAVQEPAEAAEG